MITSWDLPKASVGNVEFRRAALEFVIGSWRSFLRAALEFVIGNQRSSIFAVLPQVEKGTPNRIRLEVFPLKLTSSALRERVDSLRHELLNRGPGYRRRAAALLQRLIGPAASRLSTVKELCIVPDGPLWELPFQSLVAGNGKYLVQDFAVFYSPSLAVLREMVAARSKKLPADASAQLYALGNPTVSKPMAELIPGRASG